MGHDHHGKLKTGEGDFKGTERVRYEDLAELGDGYVFAVIESEDGTTDINEGNNVSDALSFTVAPAEASTIDLTVSAISAENTALAAGEDLELSLDVANLGNTDAHGTKTAIYWSEDNSFDAETDTLLAMDNHGQLNGGETERGETSSVDADDLADLGDGFIFAVIDHKDGIAESNESNNVSDALQITVGPADPAPRADLQISDASLDETRLEDGDDLTVEFDVLNAGVGEARGTVATAYWSATDTFDAGSAVALGTENVGFLEGGETDAGEDIRIRYEDLEGLGDGYIFVLLDAAGLVPETNTANNLSDALGFDLL